MSVRIQTILSTLALAIAPRAVMAQGPGAVPSAQRAASAAAPASAPGASLAYRSVFDGYRSFDEQPVVSWREANDLVGRIGGWQAYAREGQGGPAAGGPGASSTAGKATTPSPARPPASAAGHSGHTMP